MWLESIIRAASSAKQPEIPQWNINVRCNTISSTASAVDKTLLVVNGSNKTWQRSPADPGSYDRTLHNYGSGNVSVSSFQEADRYLTDVEEDTLKVCSIGCGYWG